MQPFTLHYVVQWLHSTRIGLTLAGNQRFSLAISTVGRSALQPEEVREQLARLLASKTFRNAKRLSEFLKFSVEETLTGRGGSISAPTIAVEVFERNRELDLKSEVLVRVQARQLRLKLESYYSGEGRNDPIKISIPQGAYSAVFDFNDPSITSGKAEPFSEEGSDINIYVEPIDYPDGQPPYLFAAKVLEHEIVRAIGSFSGVRSFSLAEDSDVGRSRAPVVILRGVFSPNGDGIMFSAQAVDNSNLEVIWTFREKFTVESNDDVGWVELAARKSVISLASTSSMVLSKLADRWQQSHRFLGDAAYWTFRGHHYASDPNPVEHLVLRTALEKQMSRAEVSSQSLALLALVYLDEYRFRFNPTSDRETTLFKAIECAKMSISKQPDNSDAWLVASGVYYEMGSFDRSRSAAEKALELNPNSTDAMVVVGVNLWTLGAIEEGLSMVDEAIELSNTPPGWYYICRLHEAIRTARLDDAETLIAKIPWADFFWIIFLDCVISALKGNISDARRQFERLREVAPWFVEGFKSIILGAPFPDDFKSNLEKAFELVTQED